MVFSLLSCFVPYAANQNVPMAYGVVDQSEIVRQLHGRKFSACRRTRHYAQIENDQDIELLTPIRDAIAESSSEEDVATWHEAIDIVVAETGLTKERSEINLAKAFGWKAWVKVTSKFAKRYMKTSIPNLADLKAALEWATDGPLKFSKEQLSVAIELSPEVYLLDPALTYKTALSVAPKEYQDPNVFGELAQQDPSVLACTVNCVDDGCASECGNCWVSYSNR